MISLGEKLQLFFRSLFLQTGWNYRGMQNIGFLYAIAPVLDRIWADQPEQRREAYKRHLQYFNTHPYLAPVVMGVVIKMEEELKRSSDPNPKLITLVKNRMAGPVAAVGDILFWESLRPVLSSVAAFAVFFFPKRVSVAEVVIGILLITFTFLGLFYRGLGLKWGLRYGIGVVEYLKSLGLQATARRVKNLGLVLIGIVMGYFLVDPRPSRESFSSVVHWDDVSSVDVLIKLAFVLLAFELVRQKWTPTRIFAVIMTLGFLAGATGWL